MRCPDVHIPSLLALLAAANPAVASPGEATVPQLGWEVSQLFQEVGRIKGPDAPDFHGTAFWYGGHLGVVFAQGEQIGGIALYDISDPASPQLVGRGTDPRQREGHTTGFVETAQGWMAVGMASNGINLWDLNDATHPHLFKNVELNAILPIDYDFGAWWVGVQSPWIYVAGSFNGIYVIDASDIEQPQLVKKIHLDSGFRAGPLFVVGNLLVQGMSNGAPVLVYDISDPANPSLLRQVNQLQRSYASSFNGGYLYGGMKVGGLEILDLNDVFQAETLSTTSAYGAGAYTMAQDSYVHLGNSDAYYLFDVTDPLAPEIVGSAHIVSDHGVDNDFVSPLGNMVALSDDHQLGDDNAGTALIPVFRDPDTTAPVVNYVNPSGVDPVLSSSRVGVTLSDQILVSSVGPETFFVRPVGGSPLIGWYSVQQQTLNFSPEEPLDVDTIYEIVLPAGGVSDLSGNVLEETFVSSFQVGPDPVNPPIAHAGPDLVSFVEQTAVLKAGPTRGGVGALEYSWDPGDGSGPQSWSSSRQFLYTYHQPGHYTAVLAVRDSQGQLDRDYCLVSVVFEPLVQRPVSSSPILYDEVQDRVWVVNPDADSVSVVDASNYDLIEEIMVGDHPTSLTLGSSGSVWVVCQDSDELFVIDADSLGQFAVYQLPRASRPAAVLADPERPTLFVSFEGTGEVWAVDEVSGGSDWRMKVGPDARALALAGETLYVSRFYSPPGEGQVWAVDRWSGATTATISLVEDPGPDSEIGGRGIPNLLTQLVPTPDGKHLLVPGMKQNTSRGLYRDGQAMTFENTNRAIMANIDVESGQERLEDRIDFDNHDHAIAMALSPYGDYGFVVFNGMQSITVVDLLDGAEVGSIPHVGLAPQGAVVTPQGSLFVMDFLGRGLTVYDVGTVQNHGSLQRLATIRTVATEPLTPEQLTGKRIFYDTSDRRMARDGYIACAGCHLDGGTDRRVWDFTDRGEGLRKTTSLRGRGEMLDGPVHWSANFDEIQDFENDIRNAFGGTGFLTDGEFQTHNSTLGAPKKGLSPELDALAAYLHTLTRSDPSPFRDTAGKLTAAGVRGRALFFDATVGCATCHSGPHFTDSVLLNGQPLLHDVGTLTAASGKRMGGPLTGIDTPTLKGTWNHGPWFHDGSATSLREVLTSRNSTNQHGKTSQLSGSQLDDLLTYVLSIDNHSGAPVVVDLQPPVGAQRRVVDVITLNFSSVVDTSTQAGLSVKVDGASVSGSWSFQDQVATFRPAAPITAGVVTVASSATVRSIDGEAAIPWSGSFTVDSGLPLVRDVHAYTSRAGAYSLASNLGIRSEIYGDNGHFLVTLPKKYRGLDYLKTASGDLLESRPAMLTFELTAPARVYVAFDRTMDLRPGWAADFVHTGDRMSTNEYDYSPFRIFEATYPAGKVVLGGPRSAGGDHNKVNYVVFFEPVE